MDGDRRGDRTEGRVSANTSWRKMDNNQLNRFRTSIQGAVRAETGDRRMDNWLDRHPDRHQHWNRWGSNFRSSYRFNQYPYFGNNFWSGRNLIGLALGFGYGSNYRGGYWGYQPWHSGRPWTYWYSTPRWPVFAGWYGWNQPYYYDYGPGGNVYYQGDQVYVNQQAVGSSAEYAQTAAALASIDPNALASTAAEDWHALGTFMIATTEDEKNPTRMIQLAVNKEGLISGSMYNRETDKAFTVQGRVDKETQRTAFTIGDNADIVLETGLYNLTQQEAPVLVHFGPSKTATYVFVRLPEPEQAETTPTAAPASALPTPQNELP